MLECIQRHLDALAEVSLNLEGINVQQERAVASGQSSLLTRDCIVYIPRAVSEFAAQIQSFQRLQQFAADPSST